MDIGITRGEIDYVVSNRSIDPQGIRFHPSDECLISGTGIGHDQAHHSPGPTSDSGQSRRFGDARTTSAFPLLATEERTSRHVSKAPKPEHGDAPHQWARPQKDPDPLNLFWSKPLEVVD
jgi:hypothetical protein